MRGPTNYPATFKDLATEIRLALRRAEILAEYAERLWQDVLDDNDASDDRRWAADNWDALADVLGYDEVSEAISRLDCGLYAGPDASTT